jgi:RND superfamily putative drug exporter
VLAGSFVVLAIVGGSGQGNGGIRVIGFGLAIGILIDTFVVRTILVPSIVELLGRWNWWPSHMSSAATHRRTDGRQEAEAGATGAAEAPLARTSTAPVDE